MRLCNPDAKYILSGEMSERINIFRLFLTILVIYNHMAASITLFSGEAVSLSLPDWFFKTKYILSQTLGRSAVPAFFLISSLLLYRKPFNWQQNMKRKLKSLAVPYLIFNTAWILLFFVLQQFPLTSGIFGNPNNIIANWGFENWTKALFGVPGIVPFLYPMWFLRDLLILNLFATLIWKIVDRLPNISLLAAIIVWLKYSIYNNSVPDYQSVCFWVFGAYIVKKNIRLESLDKLPFIVVLALFAISLWKDFGTLYLPQNQIPHNLSISIGIILVFKLCSFIKKEKLKSILLKMSAYCFSIYLFHEFTTLTFRKLAAAIFPVSVVSQFLQYLLIPILVAALCLLLSIVIKKIMPRFYALLVGGR